jgi:hypothetical protein
MTFSKRGNTLTTHFSESIPVDKRRISVIYCGVLLYETLMFNLDAGLLASSQYPEGPATGHLGTGFSWFSCVFKQMLRWFPKFQVATTCFSCSPPEVNLVGIL